MTTPKDVDLMLDTVLPDDHVLQLNRQNCRRCGLPDIEVSVQQARLLETLVSISGARRVLEIGTLGGYSTTCLARAVGEQGSVITIEYEPKHVEVARDNLTMAGVADRVIILTGPALDVLPRLAAGSGPFDFVFIDADKDNNKAYLEWAVKLTSPGATILVDNVIRDGRVLDSSRPEKLEFVRAFASHPELVNRSVIQTTGGKGWDGFAIARKRPFVNRILEV